MALLRSLCALICWGLAVLCVAAAIYQVRPEIDLLRQSWPNINATPELVANETSPSDRVAGAIPSPLSRFLTAARDVLPWLILAGVLVGNATLMRMHSAVERLE